MPAHLRRSKILQTLSRFVSTFLIELAHKVAFLPLPHMLVRDLVTLLCVECLRFWRGEALMYGASRRKEKNGAG